MTKSHLVVPICFTLVTGCALLENSEVAENKEGGAPLVEIQEPSPNQGTEASPVAPVPVIVVKNLTADDIRRIQARLRDVGLDPGPIDGIAGARTKTAFNRFRTGCEQGQNLITDEKISVSGATQGKILSRQETVTLQTELR
ncbi:MAG: hypothetical protein ACREO5_10710, partial [Candidatus Binatia bacterium]